MRVLMVNKFDSLVGGVERHITDLRRGLEDVGHVTELFTMDDVLSAGHDVFSASDVGFRRVRSGINLLWNRGSRSDLLEKVNEFEPDVIHYHSIYHQLSPSVLGVADVPVVMTLHDYKLVAPCYSLVRDGEICTLCVTEKFKHSSIRYSCVKGSKAASTLCAVESVVFLPRYMREIDRFIVPSNYAKSNLVAGGLPEEDLQVVSWGVNPPAANNKLKPRFDRYWIYGGRLHASKGVGLLLEAWAALDFTEELKLVIAGDGEMRAEVEEACEKYQNIEYLGLLDSQELANWTAGAELALVPSIAPETMGLSAVEALVLGTPIISSDAGALRDLAGPGVGSVQSADLDDWVAYLRPYVASTNLAVGMRQALRCRDLSNFSQSRMIGEIVSQYERVIASKSGG